MKKRILILSVILFLFIPIDVKADSLQVYFDSLPNNIKNYVLNSSVTISMVDEVNYYYPNGEVNALTTFYPSYYGAGDVDHMTIEIKNGRESYLVHEIGHTLDGYNHTLWFWSGTDSFKYIYLTERYNNTLFFYGNGTDNEHEYFAEAFKQYLYAPTKLKKYNPLTYDYMVAVVGMVQ